MHRIKIKGPTIFLWNEQNVFMGGFITFQSVLLWRYYNAKNLLDIGGTTIQDVAPLAAMASTPWAMSLYFKFRAIYFWLLNWY